MKRQQQINGTEIQRSPKTESLLGKLPAFLTVGGCVVLALMVLALILCMLLIQYPYGNGESILYHMFCM